MPSKAVKNFPGLFRSTVNANLVRASRLWKSRGDCMNAHGKVELHSASATVARVSWKGVKKLHTKARPGRGRKRAAWVVALHGDLLPEFDRLRKLGVKFNLKTLRALALHLVANSANSHYSRSAPNPRTNAPIPSMISARWIQSFANRFQIVSRAHTGKLQTSPEKMEFIEKEVAFHLEQLARQFESGEIDENDVENADETHFVINYDNGRTLGFAGEEAVKYADVVSGGE